MTSARNLDSVLEWFAGAKQTCAECLAAALDPCSGLFDRQIRDREWQAVHGTESTTSTAICLIGVNRYGLDGLGLELDIDRSLGALTKSAQDHAYRGGVGLVIWANAVNDGPSFEELMRQLPFVSGRTEDFLAPLTTMETAWYVSGLAHERRRMPTPRTDRAFDTALGELLERQDPESGLFHHATKAAPLSHRIRASVANFADQIYSVQALSLAAMCGGSEAALDGAEKCAETLVRLQGEQGQWWWHYNPGRGRVSQAYAVYSVHQHGMAPMALSTLAQAGGADRTEAIVKSYNWISDNELGVNMLDTEFPTIWRDIQLDEEPLARLARKVRLVAGATANPNAMDRQRLVVNYETRPYEWAWCLFAGAMTEERDPGNNIA